MSKSNNYFYLWNFHHIINSLQIIKGNRCMYYITGKLFIILYNIEILNHALSSSVSVNMPWPFTAFKRPSAISYVYQTLNKFLKKTYQKKTIKTLFHSDKFGVRYLVSLPYTTRDYVSLNLPSKLANLFHLCWWNCIKRNTPNALLSIITVLKWFHHFKYI